MKKEWFDEIIETDEDIIVTIKKQDVYDDLYETCDTVHSGCDSCCPVYAKCVEEGEFNENKSNECPYFKNGKSMFERLQGKKIAVK